MTFTLSRRRNIRAMTLVEIMIALCVSMMMFGALFAAFVNLERNYVAVQAYAVDEASQQRISDYLALDLRRALSVSLVANVLTITIPDYYNNAGAPPAGSPAVNPTIASNAVVYGATPVTISYYQLGSSFYRSVNGSPSSIADDVADFTVTPVDNTNTITCATTFSPRFTTSPATGAITATSVYTNVYLRNAAAR